MKIMNFTHARRHLSEVLDAVIDDQEPTAITRSGHEPVVLIPLAEYKSWQETEYLLRSPANAALLRESIAQADAGELVPFEPDASDVA